MGIEKLVFARQAKGLACSLVVVALLSGCDAADDGTGTSSSTGDATSTSGGSTDAVTGSGSFEGTPDINSFSLAPEMLSPEGFSINGGVTPVTAQFGDDLNSQIPDGTEVFFMAEYGVIGDSCTTTGSRCSVDWLSGEPRTLPFSDTSEKQVGDECLNAAGVASDLPGIQVPCPYANAIASTATVAGNYGGLGQVYQNRVSIMAWVEDGAETFFDANGDGLFNDGEKFIDVGEPFIDHNEDGVYGARLADGSIADGAASIGVEEGLCYDDDARYCFQQGGENETYVDIDKDGQFDPLGNGIYNGPLCAIEGDGCTKSGVTIFKQFTLLQAGSFAKVGIVNLDGVAKDLYQASSYVTPSDLMTFVGDSSVFAIYVSDFRNGFMPGGTTIEFETSYGDIVGDDDCTVLETSALGYTSCLIRIDAESDTGSGVFSVTVTTPDNKETVATRIIAD
ncbi:hypothetical protein A9Q99_04420 [Gammaproteobacteria bacterium 45_16_T64]|nr:hypothetical protein A9Q99_04420 [Gammaproteobacteria bacterium 45_16_T64]